MYELNSNEKLCDFKIIVNKNANTELLNDIYQKLAMLENKTFKELADRLLKEVFFPKGMI